jgi:Na+-translocating ferredoxin:NAD+ oxidoreductase RnfD subunit
VTAEARTAAVPAKPAEPWTRATDSGAPRRRRVDPRWFSSSLLTLILVVGQWQFQILGDSYVPWMIALGSAVATELLLHRLHTGRTPNLLSAYISGNSVAILTKPASSVLWPFWFGGVISILSKYVLRYRGRHLWNPTNFSVCLTLLLASETVSILGHQWGNAPAMVAVIWLVGSITATFARVWHLTLAYLVAFVALAWVRTLVNGQPLAAELAPVTGPMYQLFMFFMVTDPRTIVSGRAKQVAVVLVVALLECAIRLAVDLDWIHGDNPRAAAPPMFALFFVGPLALWLDLRRAARAGA